MLTNDLNIRINGFNDENSSQIIDLVSKIFKEFSSLDLRRLSFVLITTEFEKEVKTLTKQHSPFTNNHLRTISIAKVLTQKKENDFEMILVLSSTILTQLLKNDKNSIHIIHHELGHIHDNNKKIDIFKELMLHQHYQGIDSITFPLAENCWSEYMANFISSSSAKELELPKKIATSFGETIKEVEFNLKTEVLAYQSNRNRDDLLYSMKHHVEFLLKSASYVLGYMHGLNLRLVELSDEADYILETSYFKEMWDVLEYELTTMHEVYSYGWVSIEIYRNLAISIESFLHHFGLILKEDENKSVIFTVE